MGVSATKKEAELLFSFPEFYFTIQIRLSEQRYDTNKCFYSLLLV